MRFILTAGTWNPTDGAIIPNLIEKGTEALQESVTNIILHFIHEGAIWLAQNGLPLVAEMALIYGMACLLIGCTGSGKWIERGVKSVLVSIMIGVVRYAI
jgi:hypothetical protein